MRILYKRPLVAISYDTATFRDLEYWLKTLYQVNLSRLDPSNLHDLSGNNQYVNLITKDFSLREQITKKLDDEGLDRFSFIHPKASVDIDLSGSGVFIYPNVSVYPNSLVGKDVIIHGNSLIAHYVSIGKGTYISGGVTIGGSSKIGNFCFIGLCSSISDNVQIVSHVLLGANSKVKKNIQVSGTYACPTLIKKIK